MTAAARLGVWLVLLGPACGGIAERGSRDGDGDFYHGGGDAPVRDADPPDGGGYDPTKGDTELGECRLGTPEGASETCPWLADRRCYTEREMACNCVCPRSRDSLCLSGFDAGPQGRVLVTCN